MVTTNAKQSPPMTTANTPATLLNVKLVEPYFFSLYSVHLKLAIGFFHHFK